jgi:hypothetical protein
VAGSLAGALFSPLAAAALADDAGSPAAAEAVPPARPLPEHVEPPLPPATPAQLARLDSLIGELLDPSEPARLQALERVRAVDADWLPALAERFDQAAGGSTRAGVELLLGEIRGRQREPRGTRQRTRPAAERPDTLELVVRHPDRSSGYLRPLTEVLAYARMFEAIGTWPAARRVVAGYLRFGEPWRAETEQALARMGDRALPALIETTVHPTPRFAEWAKGLLEDMGKHVASEAVQVSDVALRADILLAYGKARDVGTARLLIAFAASEREQVRLAARRAVTMLGELGSVELRDAYETATGASAPRDWSWRRVAEELFARFDGQRLSEVYGWFAEGRAAEARGELEAARAAFDRVLARDPLFERGALMVPVYLAFAERTADTDPRAAELAARRAERLAPAGPEHDRALSLRYTLEAAELVQRGIVDDALVQRARQLDPNNRRAAALEAELATQLGSDRATFRRYAAAALILALALASLFVMALRLRAERAPRAARAGSGRK